MQTQTKRKAAFRLAFARAGHSIAYPIPRSSIRCKQVSRLGIILLERLLILRQWLGPGEGKAFRRLSSFVRFTVTGIARESHPRSHGALPIRKGERRVFPRRYTGYSFVALIIAVFPFFVNRRPTRVFFRPVPQAWAEKRPHMLKESGGGIG